MKKIHSCLFIFCLVFNFGSLNSQSGVATSTVETLTPGGIFDVVYDHYGNQYSLANLNVASSKPIGGGNTVQAVS